MPEHLEIVKNISKMKHMADPWGSLRMKMNLQTAGGRI